MRVTFVFVVGVIVIGWIFAVISMGYLDHRKKQKAQPEGDIMDAAYEVIAASIENEPGQWEGKAGGVEKGKMYRLVNKTRNIAIWTANNAYGLGINLDGLDVWPDDGGLTSATKKKLWKAIQKRNAALIVERFR